tara:strand:+ start:315 stop:653 length:339 start_codon:yes stop_codon:yes gene_type:complete
MKGFSGFGNSPMKQVTIKPLVNKRFKKKKIKDVSKKTALEGLAEGAANILKPNTTKTKSVKYDADGYPIGTRRVDPDGYVYTTDKYGNKIYTQKKDNVKTTKPVKRRPPSDI